MTSDVDVFLEALTNALQLCIKGTIVGYHGPNYKWSDEVIILNFISNDPDDLGLQKFEKLVQGRWIASTNKVNNLQIRNFNKIDLGLLSSFMLLTRLQDDQIVALANQDPRYRSYAAILGLCSDQEGATPIISIQQAREFVFRTIEEKKMSLTALAKSTGLSQVSLSNFKSGGDIRLSNLLKIVNALKIKLSFN